MLAVVLLLGVVSRERHAFAAMSVRFMGFERQDSAYFAPTLPRGERAHVLELLEEARRRVSRLYGPLRARPTLIVSDAQSMGRFSDTPTGVTHYQPTGTFTALGPRGQNVDVIAHELAHAELYARIGYRKVVWCVPIWLDEGLAMQFDERPTHGNALFERRVAQGWPVPALAELATHDRFFAGPRSVVRFHYAAARSAVAAWLQAKGPAQAVRSLEQLDCNRQTAALYAEIAHLLRR